MTYFLCGLIAIISPFFAVAEPAAVLAGLSTKLEWVWVAVALAFGQTISFVLMYFFGDRYVSRWQWLARKLARVNLEEYANRRNIFTGFAATIGMPPMTALSLAGPLYERRFPVFLTYVFVGRLTRFLFLAGAATYFSQYVDRSALPLWLTPYF